ncbi:hypothetical protein ACTFIR_002871 [Dictyostelium discoideum]
MFSIIKRYIKSCATCQLNINRKDNGILQSLEIPYEVWRDISIDFLSLPKTTDALNGFTVEVDQVCVIVSQLLLNHVFRLHGYPIEIQDSPWAKTMDSKLKMTVAHRAQADGQTEKMNREIKRILTKASTEYGENWSDIIPLIEFAMNSSMSKSTKMSPFQIVYGFNLPTPVNHFNSLTKTRIPMSNIKKIVRDNILDAQINAQKYYNRCRGDVIFVVGEKVMVKRKFFQTNPNRLNNGIIEIIITYTTLNNNYAWCIIFYIPVILFLLHPNHSIAALELIESKKDIKSNNNENNTKIFNSLKPYLKEN